jgi:DNA polymerase-1
MPAMSRLVLIDGSSYLYRAFHALPPLTGPDGSPTGALFGVVNMLRATLKENPDYAAFVVDASGPTFRDEMYPAYKANRPPMPDELRAQIEPMLAIVQALGIPLLRVPGVEADDVIGTLALQARREGIPVLISTGDKDFAQLVQPGITLVNTMTGTVLDEAGVQEKFGVRPDQVVDLLALMGDTVDNVPGVEKCGPKTAAKWLAEYGTLEGVMAAAPGMKGKIGENLRAALDRLPLNKQLVTIKTDVELEQGPADLKPRPRDIEALRELYRRYGFNAALKDLEAGNGAGSRRSTPPGPAALAGDTAEAPAEGLAAPGAYECVTGKKALEAWIERLRDAPLIAMDTETDSRSLLHPGRPRLSRRTGAAGPRGGAGSPAPAAGGPGPPQARSARQVRPARAAPAWRAGTRLRRGFHARELRLERRRPAPRHGHAGAEVPGLPDHQVRAGGRQGRKADPVLGSVAGGRHPLRRRGRRHHPAPAPGAVGEAGHRAAPAVGLPRHRDAAGAGAGADGGQGCAGRCRRAAPAAPSISIRPSSWVPCCSTS